MPDETPAADGGVPAPPPAVALGVFGHSVGFLVSQVGAATARHFKDALAELELEPRHFAVMRAIEAAHRQTQQLLAENLQIPASSMVALLDHLEARGLVARHLDPTDRRIRLVELTAAGHARLETAVRIAMGTESLICRGFDAEEREWLIARLQRVASNLGLAAGVHPGDGGSTGACGPAPTERPRRPPRA